MGVLMRTANVQSLSMCFAVYFCVWDRMDYEYSRVAAAVLIPDSMSMNSRFL